MNSNRIAVLAMAISALALLLNLVPVAVKLGWLHRVDSPGQQQGYRPHSPSGLRQCRTAEFDRSLV